MYYLSDKAGKLHKLNKDEVLDKLYEQEMVLPTEKELAKVKMTLNELKIAISKIDNKTPLWHELSKNMYLIHYMNVYDRVAYHHYRFPSAKFISDMRSKRDELAKQLPDLDKIDKMLLDPKTYDAGKKLKFKYREHRKLSLFLDYMNNFDYDTLYDTYLKMFYNSNPTSKNITTCLRPSFKSSLLHVTPYYTRSELINLALNMQLIKPSNHLYTPSEIEQLCEKIKVNDVDAKTILAHQKHIVESDGIGVIQYYSLQGSYFMNQYLRNQTPYKYQNNYFEIQIRAMWELIRSAPSFDRSYTVYRFISTDEHINTLQIGDTYTDTGFISTTRDPFYRSSDYVFGFILVKITLPVNTPGVGLCVESLSHFAKEQEIILPPQSTLKLIRKDSNCAYFHIDSDYISKIKTRYEFEFISTATSPVFNTRPAYTEEQRPVNFLTAKSISTLSIDERLKYFIGKYAAPFYQFTTFINKQEYTLRVEQYDSTKAYKDFYAVNTINGYLIYAVVDNYMQFSIELGEDNKRDYMYVNFYFKHSVSRDISAIDDLEFIKFIASLAHYFEVEQVVIYCKYTACNAESASNSKSNYCSDFYSYLKHKTKKYTSVDSYALKPRFSYYQLDRLRTTDPTDVVRKTDTDEIYQIYKTYLLLNKPNNLADFYVWLVDTHCELVHDLVNKIDYVFRSDNPFRYDYYILDPYMLLYNLKLIDSYTRSAYTGDLPIKVTIPKNEYRIQRVARV